jgi:selenocysteine lyase/cysteine desulfurase
VLNNASNVTGVVQPLEPIVEICRSRRMLLLVDAARSAGHLPSDFARLGIDLLACPGHKGLLGPLGTGVLLIRAGVEAHMRTVREGGTKRLSFGPFTTAHDSDAAADALAELAGKASGPRAGMGMAPLRRDG